MRRFQLASTFYCFLETFSPGCGVRNITINDGHARHPALAHAARRELCVRVERCQRSVVAGDVARGGLRPPHGVDLAESVGRDDPGVICDRRDLWRAHDSYDDEYAAAGADDYRHLSPDCAACDPPLHCAAALRVGGGGTPARGHGDLCAAPASRGASWSVVSGLSYRGARCGLSAGGSRELESRAKRRGARGGREPGADLARTHLDDSALAGPDRRGRDVHSA